MDDDFNNESNQKHSKTKFDTTYHGGAPTSEQEIDGDDMEFEFEFSGHFERAPLSSAEDLFADGKIKPLIKPPPPAVNNIFSLRNSIKRRREHNKLERERSRERTRGKRSVSPLVEDPEAEPREQKPKLFSSKSFSFTNSVKKWKIIKLFRSLSEGRSAKYTVLNRKGQEEESPKNTSVRDDVAKEREKRRWKTSLPYKHGLHMGCFGYKLPVIDDVARRNSIVVR